MPWLTFGGNLQLPEVTPKLGWINAAMEIDPFNSNRMMCGTGATIYGTTNLTDWDAGTQITIRPMVAGLEETAVLDLISPPAGAPLLSALGDIGGFRHANLDAVPPLIFTSPGLTSSTRPRLRRARPERDRPVGECRQGGQSQVMNESSQAPRGRHRRNVTAWSPMRRPTRFCR